MSSVLPQQKLLLELLVMSGDIAIHDGDGGTLLWRTLKECEENGWVMLTVVSQDFYSASITDKGREAIA